MLDRLHALKIRFEELSEKLSLPDVVADQKKYIELSKDYKELEPVVEAYKKYKLIIDNIASAREILDGEEEQEMREMAKMELDELLPQKAEMEEDIKVLLIPKDPQDNKKLQGHLMSPDFFNVKAHPEAIFKITNVKKMKSKSATHEITGELTVKEKTEKISFPVTVKMENGMATAKGTLSVDRTKFDVRYGSGKFFENLGDKMINDNFDVALDLKAKM